jgi:hypothetical protein
VTWPSVRVSISGASLEEWGWDYTSLIILILILCSLVKRGLCAACRVTYEGSLRLRVHCDPYYLAAVGVLLRRGHTIICEGAPCLIEAQGLLLSYLRAEVGVHSRVLALYYLRAEMRGHSRVLALYYLRAEVRGHSRVLALYYLGGAVCRQALLSLSSSFSSLSTAPPLIICSRVQTGQSGRRPRFRKHRIPCCWSVVR